jgi:hypothetical protein
MPPFARFSNEIAAREAALQADLANVANMSGSLSSIAAKTGNPSAVYSQSEVPSIGGLANMQATTNTLSNQRVTNSKNQIKDLPGYVKSYRSYLQWRYPTRYGSGGSDYSTTPNGSYGYDIPDLTGYPLPPIPGVTR